MPPQSGFADSIETDELFLKDVELVCVNCGNVDPELVGRGTMRGVRCNECPQNGSLNLDALGRIESVMAVHVREA